MKQVIKHRDGGLLNMIRRTDPDDKTEIQQGVHVLVGQQDHIPAVAAVAAVRPAVLHEFLPMKGNAAVAAVSGFGGKGCAINKSGHDGKHLPVQNGRFSIAWNRRESNDFVVGKVKHLLCFSQQIIQNPL